MVELPEHLELSAESEVTCPICKQPVNIIGGTYKWSTDISIGYHNVKAFISKTQYIEVACSASGGTILSTETKSEQEAA